MTPRQRRFAELVIEGYNPSGAYKAAGYGCSNPKTVANEAYKLMNHPDISAMIAEGRKAAAMSATWNRQTSIERNQRVNDVAFERLSAGNLDRDTLAAFTSTDRRLGDLLDLDFERDKLRQGLDNEIAALDPLQFMTKPTRADIRRVINNETVM